MEIVVASCRAYADAWGPFLKLFRKFWPNCCYHVKLATDIGGPEWEGDQIQLGGDLGWSSNLLHGLSFIKEELVLLMQEDFFLNGPVDSAIISKATQVLYTDDDIVCVRLMPCPGPDGMQYDENFGEITIGAPYRVSCQAAIWRKSTLERILSYTKGPDGFEIDGTIMRPEGKFLSVFREPPWPFPYFVTAINRGIWNPQALEHCAANGVHVDTTKRPIQGVQGNEGQIHG